MIFEVWAPAAKGVDLRLGGATSRMERDEHGWWRVEVDAAPGDDYGYLVNGKGPFPDPRSAYQPEGVDGLSRLLDHASYEWRADDRPPPPFESWIIYELHVGTFTPGGTFQAAIEKLDHLVDLGVNAVELLPVNAFSGHHGWGYDGVDLYAPHRAYGEPDDLKHLVDACHDRGFAVILDVVYNHLGPAGNYLGRFGPYFTNTYSTPWGDAVNLDDAYSHEVRRFFIDNALMWLEHYRFDGLRLDAVHAMLDQSAVHFLEELHMRVEELESDVGRPLHLIAESDLSDPRIVRPRSEHGYGMRAQWNDDFHHSLHSVLTGEQNGYYEDFGSIEHLARALGQAFVYDFRYSAHRKRRHGRAPKGLDGDSFLAYMQNHDQVGNRARGERISHLVDEQRVKIGAALTLLSPFIPMLFQGEEWAASTPFQYFTAHEDPQLGKAVSEGRRSEFASFGWSPKDVPDPQEDATFERSKLDWSELERKEHRDMLDWYRSVIALRKEQAPDLGSGPMRDLRVEWVEEEHHLVVRRGAFTIACNLGDEERVLSVPATATEVILSSPSPPEIDAGKARMPARSVAVLKG